MRERSISQLVGVGLALQRDWPFAGTSSGVGEAEAESVRSASFFTEYVLGQQMNKNHRYAVILALMFGFSLSTSLLAGAQQVGHLDYKMGRKSIVSVTNSYGPITVVASDAKDVQVVYTSYAKSVTFDNQRHGNRVSLVSLSDHSGDNLAEFTVLVPSHAWLTLFARIRELASLLS